MELATVLEKSPPSLLPDEMVLHARIQQSLDEIERGEVFSHEAVMAMLDKRLVIAKAKQK